MKTTTITYTFGCLLLAGSVACAGESASEPSVANLRARQDADVVRAERARAKKAQIREARQERRKMPVIDASDLGESEEPGEEDHFQETCLSLSAQLSDGDKVCLDVALRDCDAEAKDAACIDQEKLVECDEITEKMIEIEMQCDEEYADRAVKDVYYACLDELNSCYETIAEEDLDKPDGTDWFAACEEIATACETMTKEPGAVDVIEGEEDAGEETGAEDGDKPAPEDAGEPSFDVIDGEV